MTLLTPKRTAVLGLSCLVIGAVWGSYFVGVPYPDPTPAQKAAETRHLLISGWLMGFGACALLFAGVLAVVGMVRANSHANTPHS